MHPCYNTGMTTDFADLLRRIPGYAHQIAHIQPLPPRAARLNGSRNLWRVDIAGVLRARGIAP